MSIKERILSHFAALSPTLQSAARFAIDHPNEVVTLSMRTLADNAGVQPASLVRLAQQLGFSGWPEVKAAFIADMGLRSERYSVRARSLSGRGRDARLVGEVFAAQRRNLDATERQVDATLRRAATLLKRARHVHVAGFRASYPVACTLVYGYRLFRPGVTLLDAHAGGLEMQLRCIERKDAVVAISFAPYSREALEAVDAARAAGARVLAMTDSPVSPLALQAEVALLFSVQSPSFFPSIAAAITVSEALLALLVAGAGDEAVRQIDRAEHQLFDSGAYLQAPRRFVEED